MSRAETLLARVAEPAALIRFLFEFSRARLLVASGRRDEAADVFRELLEEFDMNDVEQVAARETTLDWMRAHDVDVPTYAETPPSR